MNRQMKMLEKMVLDNSPAIFTGLAVAGTITTAVLTGRASYKFAEQMGVGDDDYKSNRERFEKYGRLYIPAATSATITVGCIIAANRIGTRRAAALAAAYSLSERAFEQYRDGAVKKFGERAEREMRDDIQQCLLDDDPVTSKVVIVTNNSEVLCYEAFTGRYFMSSMESLKAAQNHVNYRLLNDGYVSLGEFYDAIGLPKTSYSEEVGWLHDNLLELEFSTTMSDDKRPCISVSYHVDPVRNYYKFG